MAVVFAYGGYFAEQTNAKMTGAFDSAKLTAAIGEKVAAEMGLEKRRKYKYSNTVGWRDENLAAKAAWQEYGTRTIPARPFISLARLRYEKKWSKIYGERLNIALSRKGVSAREAAQVALDYQCENIVRDTRETALNTNWTPNEEKYAEKKEGIYAFERQSGKSVLDARKDVFARIGLNHQKGVLKTNSFGERRGKLGLPSAAEMTAIARSNVTKAPNGGVQPLVLTGKMLAGMTYWSGKEAK